jgi:1-acyl-sn-glycerol-3-phosphate acyltransferase
VPVSINNSRYILEEQLPYLKGGNVIIEYGEPIYIENLDDTDQKHLGDYMQKIVQEMVIKNSKKIEKKKTLS